MLKYWLLKNQVFFERNLKKFLPCGFLREGVCIYIRRAWFLKKFQRDGFKVEQAFYILGCEERGVCRESFYEGEGCMWGCSERNVRDVFRVFLGVKWRRCGVEKRLAELVV